MSTLVVDDQQLLALIEGRSDTVVADEEFLRRPREVSSFATLGIPWTRARPSTRPCEGSFNFNQVGLVGQSFGGYTGLALAGANFDLENFRPDLPPLRKFP